MSKSAGDKNFELGREIQVKFEFYLVALIFSIFGFCVQTITNYENIFSIISLICLLISGLCGLLRIEKTYLTLMKIGIIQKLNQSVNHLGKKLDKTKNLYEIQKWFLVIGLIFLLIYKIGYNLIWKKQKAWK